MVALCVTLCLAVLAGCGGDPVPDSAAGDVRRLLERRAHAVLERDAKAYERTEWSPAARSAPADLFANVRDMPLDFWEYRLTGLDRSGARATARARLSYRVKGYDRAPLTAERTLALERHGGRWYVTSERPARKAGQQLWDQGRVRAERGRHSLVLGVGQSAEERRAYRDLAERAVPAVNRAWREEWPEKVIVLVPRTLDGMAGLLGAPAAGYRGIAAVTTGEAGGSGRAPADRVIVNPEAYGVLGDFGKQVVLTHETVHVATRSHTSRATPLWLSEGFADWVGYRGTGRTAAQAAPELRRAAERERLPATLPDDADFGFGGEAERLAGAYEGAWLACRMIAERWGERALGEFYRAVGAHGQRAGAVEDALRDVLDTTPEEFTARWRTYLRSELR
ncbi:Lipoprotein OS=Streptomyces alboniger OX=132473 GN=CP975_09390 PE=4 SV=1 [Streptomyces alboniger]